MAFTVKVWNGQAAGAAALEAEATAIAYSLRRCINQPCEATVTLNDVNFAMTQKYWVIGASARVGFALEGVIPQAQVQIEDPTGTKVFDGVCMEIRPQPESGTVELVCKDWLEQLDHQEVIYETRADLDGAGLRESVPYRMTAAGPDEQPIYFDGNDTYVYDTVAGTAWAAGTWTNITHYVALSQKMAGTGEVWHGADHKANGVGILTNDFDDTWLDNGIGTFMQYQDMVGGLNIGCELHFECWISETYVDSLELEWRSEVTVTAPGSPFQVEAYDFTNTTWRTMYLHDYSIFPATNQYEEEHRTINLNRWKHLGVTATDYMSSGEVQIRFQLLNCGLADSMKLFFVRLTTHYVDVPGITSRYSVGVSAANYLKFQGIDLTSLNWDKHCAYSLTKALYRYVQDLCGTYDTTIALDTSTDLVTSTTTLARHYPNMTPLAILRDMAKVSGTDFWLDKALHLHWNDAYAVAGAPTITDSDVVEWVNPNLRLSELANSIRADGMQYSTTQVTHTETTAASITNYGTFTKIVNEPALYNAKDAETFATSLLAKLDTPMLRVGYTVNGLTSYEQGKVITINSAHLNVNTTYVVTDIDYDSRQGISRLICTPRQTTIFPAAQLKDVGSGVQQSIVHATRHVNYDPLHTETWT